jgi:predicted signal transduction protein with EAL and GGDEF domain
MTWVNVLVLVLGSAGGGGLITAVTLYLLKWKRFKNMDQVEVEEKRAAVKRMGVETDILISAETMKLVEYLQKENARRDEYLNQLQEELDAARKRNEKLQLELDHEKEMNKQMATELEQVKVKLQQYERNRMP